jgi:hypothetical protein
MKTRSGEIVMMNTVENNVNIATSTIIANNIRVASASSIM